MAESENRKTPNFRKIFFAKLASIKPLSEEGESRWGIGRWDLEQVGIDGIKRMGPAAVFWPQRNRNDYSRKFQIWLENPEDIENHTYPHWEVKDNLDDFFLAREIPHKKPILAFSSFVLEDEKGRIYLAVEGDIVTTIARDVEDYLKKTDRSLFAPLWLDLVKQYKLRKIIGNIGKEERNEKWISSTVTTETVLDLDMIGKMREDRYKYDFTQKYGMSWAQYMRFRLLVEDPDYMLTWGNYDNVAKMVVEDQLIL